MPLNRSSHFVTRQRVTLLGASLPYDQRGGERKQGVCIHSSEGSSPSAPSAADRGADRLKNSAGHGEHDTHGP
jgi:hypothetical protein